MSSTSRLLPPTAMFCWMSSFSGKNILGLGYGHSFIHRVILCIVMTSQRISFPFSMDIIDYQILSMRTTLSLMLLLLLWIMCRHLCSIPYRKHVQTFAFAHVFFLMFCIHWLIGNSVVFIPFATWPMERPKKKWNEFTNNRYCWWYCCSDTMAIITLSIHSCASPQGRCLLFYSPIYAHFTYFRRSGCSTFSHCFVPLSLTVYLYIYSSIYLYISLSRSLAHLHLV